MDTAQRSQYDELREWFQLPLQLEERDYIFQRGDSGRFQGVLDAYKDQNIDRTTLYFVKVKRVSDNKEFYKVGITSMEVDDRFVLDERLELVEIIEEHSEERDFILFAEYQLIKKYGLYAKEGFDGDTELINDKHKNKVRGLISNLWKYKKNETTVNIIDVEDDVKGASICPRWGDNMQVVYTDKGIFIDKKVGEVRNKIPGYNWSKYKGMKVEATLKYNVSNITGGRDNWINKHP